MCVGCEHHDQDCSHLPFDSMPRIGKCDRDGVVIVRCGEYAKAEDAQHGV